MHLILFIFLFSLNLSAAEIRFSTPGVHFAASYNKKSLRFTDQMGSRNIKVKKCNKKLIDAYWANMLDPIKKIKGRNANIKTASWVSIQGVRYPLVGMDPIYKMLIRKPASIHGLHVASLRQCRKK